MFKRLLVLLDGSPLAETAVPIAAQLARLVDGQLTLLHIVERHAPTEVHHVRHLANVAEANAYLNEVAHRSFLVDLPVDIHVHSNAVDDVTRSIVEHAGELRADSIAMCTHGRGGPRRFLFGSIAQQVIAHGTTPVLLIPPRLSEHPPQFNLRQILVPLDGDPDHEQGLPVAIDLAQIAHAAIHLVVVVPKIETLKDEKAATGKLLPIATTAILDMQQSDASEYLQNQIARAADRGVPITSEVSRGDPAEVVIDAARRVNADLIVLGTHGKTGMDAFWSNSITPKVSDQSPAPVLLVRIQSQPAKS
jgi:nucleotide-binding universal stress UspA family protein